jgi:hypothetical protein
MTGRPQVLDGDAAAPRVSRAGGRRISELARVARDFVSRRSVALIAGFWCSIAFATILWVWGGLNPLVFQVTDEAVVRQAAGLVSQHGSPFLRLPFPDPEDLVHVRSWVTLGDRALPMYAPVGLYLFGLLLRFHWLGLLLIELLPCSALGAFAAGTARLLPPGRRWLALLTPALGFVSLYWLFHPWLLLSPVMASLCWAFFFWTRWREDGRVGWLVATTLCVALASAIRPDYAGFLLLAMLLLLLSSDLAQWRTILKCAILAGVCAVVPNLILNKLTTGHALRAVYQIALDRQYGADDAHGLDNGHGLPGFAVLRVLMMPMGMPTFEVLCAQFKKYFITMNIAPLLLLGQLALLPLARKKSGWSRALFLAALLLSVFFVVTHLHDGFFGAGERLGFVYHSIPRYLSPIFLFAALPPLLFLGNCRRKLPLILGSVLACSVAAVSVYQVYVAQPSSLAAIRNWVGLRSGLLDLFTPRVPPDAIVYSVMADKIFWSKWRVGMIDDPERTATSMNRAADAGLPVFLYEQRPGRQFRELVAALRTKQFAVVKVDAHRGLYRLARKP